LNEPLGEQDFNDNLKAEIESINASLSKISQMMKTQKEKQGKHLKLDKSQSMRIKEEVEHKMSQSISLWNNMMLDMQD